MTPPQAEFDLGIDDIKAFFADALPRSPVARRQTISVMIVCAVGAIAGGLLLCYFTGEGFPPSGVWLFWIGLAVVLSIYFTPGTLFNQQMKRVVRLYQSEEHRKHLGPTKIELRAYGVASASPMGASIIDWKAITEIVSTPDYVFLHLDSLTAMIIPRRGFPDDASFDRFIDAARLYQRNAGSE